MRERSRSRKSLRLCDTQREVREEEEEDETQSNDSRIDMTQRSIRATSRAPLGSLLVAAASSGRKVKRVTKVEKEKVKEENEFRSIRARKKSTTNVNAAHEQWMKSFRSRLEDHKRRKVIFCCSCNVTKWITFKERFNPTKSVLRKLGRVSMIVCCPPIPVCQVDKAAFWPPPRNYMFFRDPADPIQQPAKAKEIVRRVNKSCMNLSWRLSIDHICADELLDVQGFVVRTEYNEYIGCARTVVGERRRHVTILYSHTNAEDLSDLINKVPSIVDMATFYGCEVVTYDFSGYGVSTGSPSEDNIYADIMAVFAYITVDMGILPETLVLLGYSIGTVAALYLAAMCAEKGVKLAGLILIAPMTTICETACGCCGPCNCACCGTQKFDNKQMICHVACPLLIIHGLKDKIVPCSHSEVLLDQAKKHDVPTVEPLWVKNCNHHNVDNFYVVWERIDQFLASEIYTPPKRTKTPSTVVSPVRAKAK